MPEAHHQTTHTMPRLYVTQALAAHQEVAFSPEQSHYLARVMRCKEGQSLRVFNGKDGEWLATIHEAHKKHMTACIASQLRAQAAEPDIQLAFAPIKHGKIDFLAQKATELGASMLLPIQTERTIVSRVNEERLYANSIEAAEQSERLTIPTIAPYQPLPQFLDQFPSTSTLIYCDESGAGTPLPDALERPENLQKAYTLLIGPEGGFTPKERTLLHAHPCTIPVGLGPRVMRADTAALAALAIIQAKCGDWHLQPNFRTS